MNISQLPPVGLAVRSETCVYDIIVSNIEWKLF